jgi:hypothetical protein
MSDEASRPLSSSPRRAGPRHWLRALLLAAISLAISMSISLARWPQPQIQDEFSNLLAADTFCNGRLANPTHPHWEHFESFHIIHQPTYASKYPPGQGAVLALGQWLTGEPAVGLWIASAVATVACYWMLLGWTSPRWALAGAAVVVVNPGYHLYWGQLFWGGTLAMTGGALVFGAALRIVKRSEVRDAVAMATGAVVLAVSRPYEGFALCLLVGGWVIIHWVRRGVPFSWSSLLLNTALPQAIILLAGGAMLARYNYAVTGDPLKLPYMVHEETYGQAPLFHGQAPVEQTYRHKVLDQFHSGWSMEWYRVQRTLGGFLRTKFRVSWFAAAFFVPPLMALPLALFALRPQLWARGRTAAPLAIAGLTYLASLACLWNFPHYMAPLAPLLLIATVAGLRYLDALGRLRIGLRPYGEALIALQGCLFLAEAINRSWEPIGGWHEQRAQLLAEFEASPDKHLIFVRYEHRHNTIEEWVYNRADIDGAKVVWARAMNPERDRALMEYFRDHKLWLLEPDKQQMHPLARKSAETDLQLTDR